MLDGVLKNAVIEAAKIANASELQKEKIQQEIDDYKRTTIFLVELFQDRKYRDSLFTLDSIFEITRKDMTGQLNGDMDQKKIESILEILIDNVDLGRVAMGSRSPVLYDWEPGSVTYYGLKSPATPGKRLLLKNNDFDVVCC